MTIKRLSEKVNKCTALIALQCSFIDFTIDAMLIVCLKKIFVPVDIFSIVSPDRATLKRRAIKEKIFLLENKTIQVCSYLHIKRILLEVEC